jgi:PAS domain S-box-containing protein
MTGTRAPSPSQPAGTATSSRGGRGYGPSRREHLTSHARSMKTTQSTSVELAEAIATLTQLADVGAKMGVEPALTGMRPPAHSGVNSQLKPGDEPEDNQVDLAETRYRTLIEQIPAVTFLASLAGGRNELYVSPQIESLLGFTQEEWVSDPILWYRQTHPDDRERVSLEFATACLTGQAFRSVIRVLTRDDTVRWVHAEARFVRDERGQLLFLQGVGFDVTEQFRAQEAREQLILERAARAEADRERERLREMFSSLPAAVSVLHGPDHIIEFLNPVAYELAGADSEALGKSWAEAFPEFGEETVRALDSAVRTGEAYVVQEYRTSSPRWGGERFFHFVCQPLSGPTGSVTLLVTQAVDVTEQVRAREAVERTAEVLDTRARQQAVVARLGQIALSGRAAQELMEQAVGLVADTLAVDYCKVLELLPDGAELLLRAGVGWSEGLVGHAKVSSGRDSQAGFTILANEPVIVDDLRTETRFTGPPLLHEHQVVSGVSCVIQGHGRPFGVMSAHAVQHRAFTLDDVHFVQAVSNVLATAIERERADLERAELLERERTARTLAEEAVRAREEFLSIASHELRNPVAAIKGTAQLMRRFRSRNRLDLDQFDQYLGSIETSSSRLATLTEDLLDVTRLQRGELPLRLCPTDLSDLIRDVVARQSLQDPEHTLDIELQSGLPIALIDPDRVDQILVNLIENAAKYSPAGGQIRVTLTQENQGLLLSVQDQGIGLPEGTAERIFEPFGRTSNAAAANIPGLGLGLYICRRIAEQHCGRIWAESAGESRGTSMFLWLPITPANEGPSTHA